MEGIVSKDRLLGGRTFTQVKHVTIMQKHHINNIATYTLLCSALGIGVLMLMFSIIPVLAGTVPTTSVKVYVWIIFFLLIVLFALSLIYWLLDVGQYILDRTTRKEVIARQVNEDDRDPVEIANESQCEQKNALTSEPVHEDKMIPAEQEVEPQPVVPELISDQEAMFNKRYVTEEYKDMHIFEVIMSMKNHGDGGSYFIRVTKIAKGLKVINRMLPYKDAKMIFGEDFVGKASNYNTQLNKEDNDVDKIYEIKKIFKEKLEIMQKRYPREKSMFDEALEN